MSTDNALDALTARMLEAVKNTRESADSAAASVQQTQKMAEGEMQGTSLTGAEKKLLVQILQLAANKNSEIQPAVDELKKLRHIGAMLQGHPDMKGTPGIDMSSGSLGQGISAAAGMALAGKIDNKDYRVYSLLGDGEIEEGQVWEAAMFASHNNLDNLCLIVDFNGLQIDGPVSEVAGPEPIDKKFEAFGFDVQTIDGHDFDAIEAAFARAKTVKGKPSVIIAKTVKGKGVSYMENQVGWHGTAPNKEQYETAMQELTAALHELEGC